MALEGLGKDAKKAFESVTHAITEILNHQTGQASGGSGGSGGGEKQAAASTGGGLGDLFDPARAQASINAALKKAIF